MGPVHYACPFNYVIAGRKNPTDGNWQICDGFVDSGGFYLFRALMALIHIVCGNRKQPLTKGPSPNQEGGRQVKLKPKPVRVGLRQTHEAPTSPARVGLPLAMDGPGRTGARHEDHNA